MQYEHCFGAAGLHPQRERRSAGNAGLERRHRSRPLRRRNDRPVVKLDPADGCSENQSRLVVVRNDAHHARQVGDLVGPTRRVAAGDDDLRGRIDSRDAPDRLPRRLIGARRHRTGVHDDDVGLFGRDGDRAVRAKAFLDSQRIGLVDATAEGDDGVLHLRLSTTAVVSVSTVSSVVGSLSDSAFRPMSRRYCMPSNEICSTPA